MYKSFAWSCGSDGMVGSECGAHAPNPSIADRSLRFTVLVFRVPRCSKCVRVREMQARGSLAQSVPLGLPLRLRRPGMSCSSLLLPFCFIGFFSKSQEYLWCLNVRFASCRGDITYQDSGVVPGAINICAWRGPNESPTNSDKLAVRSCDV